MKTKTLFLIALIFTVGCASVKVQTTPTFEDWETGKITNFTTITLTDTNAFSPSTAVKIVLQCEPAENENERPRCRPSNVGRQDTVPGVISGFGSVVVNSAAIVGGAYFVGKGLGNSGDNVSNKTTNSNESTNSSEDIVQTGYSAQVGDKETNMTVENGDGSININPTINN